MHANTEHIIDSYFARLISYISFKSIGFISQVKFAMDEHTTLADLLALNLHDYEDEVSTPSTKYLMGFRHK